MKAALLKLLSVTLVLGLVLVATAEDKKDEEKTLKGTLTCAKCELKEADKCHTVIKVKEKDKDKDVVYWLDEASSKKNHREICTEAKKGSVKGVVSEKDGKKWVKASEVKFEK